MRPLAFRFQIRSDFQYLPLLTQIFYKLKTKDPFRLTQILVEAFNNAVIHGHQHKKNKWIELQIETDFKKTKVVVCDNGKGLQKKMGDSTLWKTHGRGMKIIQAFASETKNYRTGKKHCLEAKIFHE